MLARGGLRGFAACLANEVPMLVAKRSISLLRRPIVWQPVHRSATSHAPSAKGKSGFLKKAALVTATLGVGAFGYFMVGNESDVIVEPALNSGDISFRNAQLAFQSKSTGDIVRALAIFKVCSANWIVSSSNAILRWAEKLHLDPVAYSFIRHTFFKHFCAGEKADEVRAEIASLRRKGVSTLLGLSMELDADKEVEEDHCDHVADLFVECVEVAGAQPNNFVAVKLTAMTHPALLLHMSSFLVYLKALFAFLDQKGTGRINVAEFTCGLKKLGYTLSDSDANRLFSDLDINKDGVVDYVDFTTALPVSNPVVSQFLQPKNRPAVVVTDKFVTIDQSKVLPSAPADSLLVPPEWTDKDMASLARLVQRIDKICQAGAKHHVCIIIDAEQTYFQPAIDNITLNLCRKFNKDDGVVSMGPLVYNTHQMYLKHSVEKLAAEYEQSVREKWHWGVKMVRGAYMVQERNRAKEIGIPDPINNTKADTDNCYNAGVQYMLAKIADMEHRRQIGSKNLHAVGYMIASHNEDTVRMAVATMAKLGLPSNCADVRFGQLMGMCDHVSLTLARKGYNIYKYIPYGPIHEVIPYLIRRAQENNSVLARLEVEEALHKQELRRRIKETFHLPTSTAKGKIQSPSS
eukprot:comp23296_c0_seq1/m.38239 comp23296_c0_seq1/g.38239  ORF comp23296_c0_seq1/g.38239 comp23296_c0_seq1/m.38239 type:complete len:633 (-) comp23296_c0_seq1:554-2452(-)